MEDLTLRPNMNNADVDERVEKAVKDGHQTFAELSVRLRLLTFNVDFRVVDKSLQRLRRANKLYFDKTVRGWHAVV